MTMHCPCGVVQQHRARSGSHLETRASALMRKMHLAATAPPRASKEGKPKGIKLVKSGHAAAHFTWERAELQGRGFAWCEQVLGDEAMTLVRKLRTLQRKKDEMDQSRIIDKTKKYLVRCQMVMGGDGWLCFVVYTTQICQSTI